MKLSLNVRFPTYIFPAAVDQRYQSIPGCNSLTTCHVLEIAPVRPRPCVYDHFAVARTAGLAPRPWNKLVPRYLRGKCFVVRVRRGVAKFASVPAAAGRKDKSVFEFRWITTEQGIS